MVVVMQRDQLLACTLLEKCLHPFVVVRFPPPVDAVDWDSFLNRRVVGAITVSAHLDHSFVCGVDSRLEEVRRIGSLSQLFHLLAELFRRVCWKIFHMNIGLDLEPRETETGRERHTQRERERARDRDRHREREKETERDRDRQRARDRGKREDE
jgi:hypothetical protein